MAPAIPVAEVVPLPGTVPQKFVSPQTLISFMAMVLVFEIVTKILYSGTSELQSQVLILASTTVGVLLAFWLRTPSIAPHQPAPTTTTVVEPAKATTTTAPTPPVVQGPIAP